MAPLKKGKKRITKTANGGEINETLVGEGPMDAADIEETIESLRRVTSHENTGVVIVLESFTEGKRKGIQGKVFCHGLDVMERVQAILPAIQAPKELIMVALMMNAEK